MIYGAKWIARRVHELSHANDRVRKQVLRKRDECPEPDLDATRGILCNARQASEQPPITELAAGLCENRDLLIGRIAIPESQMHVGTVFGADVHVAKISTLVFIRAMEPALREQTMQVASRRAVPAGGNVPNERRLRRVPGDRP